MSTVPTAAMLLIGNELLSGRTRDLNLHFLAEELAAMGIQFMEARVVRDSEADITDGVNALRERYDYVFTTGGIGPTHDDITAASMAVAFGRVLEQNSGAVEALQAYYDKPDQVTETRLRMAMMPENVELIPNSVSGAPGFCIENVYVMAGVPRIFQAMFHAVKGSLRQGQPVLSRAVSAYVPESKVAEPVREIQARHPEVDIGSYPQLGEDGSRAVSLVVRGTDAVRIDAALAELRTALEAHSMEVFDGELKKQPA